VLRNEDKRSGGKKGVQGKGHAVTSKGAGVSQDEKGPSARNTTRGGERRQGVARGGEPAMGSITLTWDLLKGVIILVS